MCVSVCVYGPVSFPLPLPHASPLLPFSSVTFLIPFFLPLSSLHFSLLLFSPISLLPSCLPPSLSLSVMGDWCRPYGLEEDVRQYEQDLAKRLYQSRVRASQASANTNPNPSSSSSSQPRSALALPCPVTMHLGGCALGCLTAGRGGGIRMLGLPGPGTDLSKPNDK